MNIIPPDICILDHGTKTYPKPRYVATKFSQVIAKSPNRLSAIDAYMAVNCAKVHVPWVKIESDGTIILEWSNKKRGLFVKVNHLGTHSCVTDTSRINIIWKRIQPSTVENTLFHLGKYLYGSESCEGSK